MVSKQQPARVGAPDPELRTSPIVEPNDEQVEGISPELDEHTVCYFNNVSYRRGDYVCSGSGELLRCERGVWLQMGGCDPDNP